MIDTASPAVSVRRAEDQALTRAKTRTHLRVITFAGTLTVLGYICYFVLMQSHALWGAPTLLQDRWKGIFYAFVALFPPDWVRPPWDSPFRPLAIALYLLLVAAMFAVYVWAVRRTFRVGSLRAAHAAGG